MSRIKPFIKLALPMLIPLCVGYLLVFISFATSFEPAASGALLVGTCILAELQLNKQTWRKAAI